MYTSDLQSLLEHTVESVEKLSKQSAVGKINKVILKNTLENMRSILDYTSQDVSRILGEITNRSPRKSYFPYKRVESDFVSIMQNSFPGLSTEMPKVYATLESIQPFKTHDNWLVDLCKFTNDAKHNMLTATKHEKSVTVKQGNSIVLSGRNSRSYGNVEISPHPQGYPFAVMSNYTKHNIRLLDSVYIDENADVSITTYSGGTKITTDNKFKFEGRELEIVPFLEHCNEELKKFTIKLGASLANRE